MADGAEWREETPSALGLIRTGSSACDSKSPFAVACCPGALVGSALFEDEGWYSPAASIPDLADGRPIIISREPETVLAGRFSGDSDRLRELLKAGNIPELRKMLVAKRENAFLRNLVYTSLLSSQPLDKLHGLVESVAANPPPLLDLKMDLAIRTARVTKEASPALVQSLRAAIVRFPTEPSFYVMLGTAYEAGALDNAKEYARRCYENALNIAPYGKDATKIKDSLRRLDNLPQVSSDDDALDDETEMRIDASP